MERLTGHTRHGGLGVPAVVIGVVAPVAITHGLRWKVSLRLGGIAGSITVLVLLLGPIPLVLTPLVWLGPLGAPTRTRRRKRSWRPS